MPAIHGVPGPKQAFSRPMSWHSGERIQRRFSFSGDLRLAGRADVPSPRLDRHSDSNEGISALKRTNSVGSLSSADRLPRDILCDWIMSVAQRSTGKKRERLESLCVAFKGLSPFNRARLFGNYLLQLDRLLPREDRPKAAALFMNAIPFERECEAILSFSKEFRVLSSKIQSQQSKRLIYKACQIISTHVIAGKQEWFYYWADDIFDELFPLVVRLPIEQQWHARVAVCLSYPQHFAESYWGHTPSMRPVLEFVLVRRKVPSTRSPSYFEDAILANDVIRDELLNYLTCKEFDNVRATYPLFAEIVAPIAEKVKRLTFVSLAASELDLAEFKILLGSSPGDGNLLASIKTLPFRLRLGPLQAIVDKALRFETYPEFVGALAGIMPRSAEGLACIADSAAETFSNMRPEDFEILCAEFMKLSPLGRCGALNSMTTLLKFFPVADRQVLFDSLIDTLPIEHKARAMLDCVRKIEKWPASMRAEAFDRVARKSLTVWPIDRKASNELAADFPMDLSDALEAAFVQLEGVKQDATTPAFPNP